MLNLTFVFSLLVLRAEEARPDLSVGSFRQLLRDVEPGVVEAQYAELAVRLLTLLPRPPLIRGRTILPATEAPPAS
jgi:hypothetical protein